MKAVITPLFILIILFLSEQVDVLIKKDERISIRISFILFSITLYPEKKNKNKKLPPFISFGSAYKTVRLLLRRSVASVTVIRGLRSIASPIESVAFPLFLPYIQHLFSYYCCDFSYHESIDADRIGNAYIIKCRSSVINFLYSLTIFVWYSLLENIKRRKENAG